MEQEYHGIPEVTAELNASKKPLRVYVNTETHEVFASPGYVVEIGTFPPNTTPYDPPYEESDIRELVGEMLQAMQTPPSGSL